MKGFDTYCDFLERVTAANVAELETLVSPGVRFKDPFNDVVGASAMRAVFDDMFEHVQGLEFHIHHRMTDG